MAKRKAIKKKAVKNKTPAKRARVTPQEAGERLRQLLDSRVGKDRQSVTLRMDPELYMKLKKVAAVNKTKVSYIIEDLLIGYFDMR